MMRLKKIVLFNITNFVYLVSQLTKMQVITFCTLMVWSCTYMGVAKCQKHSRFRFI